jgi:hypothetical protein
MPTEPGEFVALAIVVRKLLFQVGQDLFDVPDHLRVERPDRAPAAGRAEILLQALAAPGGLDQQHLVVVMLAHDMPELELRTDLVRFGPIAHAQSALAAEIPDPDVIADQPFAVLVSGVPEALRRSRVLDQKFQGSLAAVGGFRGSLHRPVALHVRLAREDEDLDRAFARLSGEPCQRRHGHGDHRNQTGRRPTIPARFHVHMHTCVFVVAVDFRQWLSATAR